MWVQSLGWEDTLDERMATHSSLLAWKIPWTEEPGGLQSMGSQSQTILSDGAHTYTHTHTHTHTHTTHYVSAGRPRQDQGFGIHFQRSDLLLLLQISLSKSMLCSLLQNFSLTHLIPLWLTYHFLVVTKFPISLHNVSYACLSSPLSLSLDPFSLPPGQVQPPVSCPHSRPGPCPSLYPNHIPPSKPHCSPDAKVPTISKAVSKDFSLALNDSSSLSHHYIPLFIYPCGRYSQLTQAKSHLLSDVFFSLTSSCSGASHLGTILPPEGHLAMSGDSFGCHNRGRAPYWHRMLLKCTGQTPTTKN